MIRLEQFSVRYGAIPALQEVSLEIGAGECVLLTGPSGCGKSTLGLALAGLIPHAIPAVLEGQIEVAGIDPRASTLPELAQTVGIVFQRPATQLFHLQVEQEIAFGTRNLGLDEAEVRTRTDWALQATGIRHLRLRRPAELSGGQKQCVAIAAVLAMRPRVLILDEPTSSLDAASSRLVMDTLAGLRERLGLTMVIVEHRLAEVTRIASRMLVLDQGRVVADGSPHEVLAHRDFVRQFGMRRPSERQALDWNELVVEANSPRPALAPLLRLERVTAGYQRQAVIHAVDLEIYPGDFVALVGENGAGKSTLGLVAAGLLKPLAGQVRSAHGRPPRPGVDVAMLFQNPEDQLLCDTVDQEVAFAPRNFGCFAPEPHEQILAGADLLGLRERNPSLLSVGQQQRTALAACLAARPGLLILDEPTLGQDWGHLQQMMAFLAGLNRLGTAILLISHDHKVIHRFARRLVIMQAGRILRSGQVAENSPGFAPGHGSEGANHEVIDA